MALVVVMAQWRWWWWRRLRSGGGSVDPIGRPRELISQSTFISPGYIPLVTDTMWPQQDALRKDIPFVRKPHCIPCLTFFGTSEKKNCMSEGLRTAKTVRKIALTRNCPHQERLDAPSVWVLPLWALAWSYREIENLTLGCTQW